MTDDLTSSEHTPTFANGRSHVVIDLRVYRLAAVQKTAYQFADRCTVILGALADDRLPLTFVFLPGTSEAAGQETLRLFFQDLLDQELREQIGAETHAMRSLILAHAFSNTDLIKDD